MALTQKQEAFVAKYLECDNATQAYKYAYNAENMKDETIWGNACELLKSSKVAVRLQELKKSIQDKVLKKLVIDREYITKRTLFNIDIAEAKFDPSVALKGLDMLGKMYDLNEDKQNDRLVSNKDRLAIVENYKKRIIDVTPVKENE